MEIDAKPGDAVQVGQVVARDSCGTRAPPSNVVERVEGVFSCADGRGLETARDRSPLALSDLRELVSCESHDLSGLNVRR